MKPQRAKSELSATADARREARLVWGLFAVLAYFPLFLDLDVLPLRMWDESRLAVSAFEMLKNHQFLVPYFDGAPDLWSTKPPLLIWVQSVFFAVLGPGELALRLPSALAAFATGALIVHVGMHWLKKRWFGLVAGLILCTSQGYISMHVARSGDYDSLLTFFMFLSVLCVFRYERTRSRRAISILFAAVALAVLTKGVQALLMLPGCALYLLLAGAGRDVLKERHTWFGLAGMALVAGGYYMGRELLHPGYLQAVWNNELGGRYGIVLEGHRGEWDYYFLRFLRTGYTHWYLLVPCGLAMGFAHRDKTIRRWTLLLTCTGASYLAVISKSATKCQWYDAPMYPVLASLSALPLLLIFEWLDAAKAPRTELRKNMLPHVWLFLVFVLPYSGMVHELYKVKDSPAEAMYYHVASYLKEASKGERELKADVFCHDDYNGPLLFYAHVLTDQGHPLKSVSKHVLSAGMRALAGQEVVKEYIEHHYEYRIVDSTEYVRVYEIRGPANAQP